MDDVLRDATQAILPFLGTSVGVAAQGFAERTGASLSDGTLRIVERIRERLAGSQASEPDVAEGLRKALEAGEVTERDLQILVAEVGTSKSVHIQQSAGKSIYNAPIKAGIFNG
jgi:hypothetical protein